MSENAFPEDMPAQDNPAPARTRSRESITVDPTPPKPRVDILAQGEIGRLIGDASRLHGPNVIRSAELRPRFKHIPTNIFQLDMGLHGGIPEGVISLIYGRAGSGKTTLCKRTIGQAQKKYPDMAAVFIDLEGTYQPEWGATHGIDNSRMALIQPDTGEQALDLARGAVKANEVSVVVVDSLAALTPIKEIEKSMEDLTVGEQAKLIARFCRTIQSDMLNERKRGHRPAILWINQWRMKIGTMYGDPRVLPGGDAQHYAAAVKIEMKNKEVMGKDANDMQTVDYNEHSFKIDKSKVGTGIREGEFTMIRNPSHYLGQGFVDDAKVVVTWARKVGLITGGGSSWTVDGVDTKFGRLQEIADYFYSDDEFYTDFKDRLVRMYRAACGLQEEYM